jgi:hypothetical protein
MGTPAPRRHSNPATQLSQELASLTSQLTASTLAPDLSSDVRCLTALKSLPYRVCAVTSQHDAVGRIEGGGGGFG